MPERFFNSFIIIFFIAIAIYITYRLVKKDYSIPEEGISNPYDIEYLVSKVKEAFDNILNLNISDLNLNKSETLKRERNKSLFRQAYRDSCFGDLGAKESIINDIANILQKQLEITEDNINKIEPFNGIVSNKNKFGILLLVYKKKYKLEALKELIIKFNLAELKKEGAEEFYEISSVDISNAYKIENPELSYTDKLNFLSQRIYEKLRGLGSVDAIRDMKIDGMSAGVSGIPFDFYTYDMDWRDNVNQKNLNSYESVWIFFQGKTIWLSFLSMESQSELIRACKNIGGYGSPGQFSESKGYIKNETKDGARITVFRPSFSASWAFFLRRYDSIEKKDLNILLTDVGKEEVISLLELMVKTKNVIVVTGEMGSGKTSFLMGLIMFLPRTRRIRIHEQIFEVYLQKHYPNRNILSLRETENIYGKDALDIIKTTDGDVTILGEVATHIQANWLLDTIRVNPHTTLCTNHADTTDNLIHYFTDAKLTVGGHNDAKRAEQDVSNLLNFDIHFGNKNGHRYIERITEIVPIEYNDYPDDLELSFKEFFRRITNYRTYKTVDIVKFIDGQYKIINELSERTKKGIYPKLNNHDKQMFENIFTNMEPEANL